jgi:dihydrodipicolinate synthase/N-acetylneuraminate lyase
MQKISDHPVTGVITPTITFFQSDGSIVKDANQLLIKHIIANHADCIFPLGSTGEGRFFLNKPEEKKKYLRWVKEAIESSSNPDIPIIIGAYGEKGPEVNTDAKLIHEIFPDAALVIPPPVNRKLSPPEQREFYSSILDSESCPIYAYNNPASFGGTNIDTTIMEGLKEYPHFKGLKDSSGSSSQKEEYLKLVTSKYTVSCGKEGMLAEFLALIPVAQRKLLGIVPSIANLTNTCHEIVKFGLEGNDSAMLALQAEMNIYREKIYDGAVASGKAQRGVKIAFAYLYKDMGIEIPTSVSPKLQREIPLSDIQSIQHQTDELVKNGSIIKVSK